MWLSPFHSAPFLKSILCPNCSLLQEGFSKSSWKLWKNQIRLETAGAGTVTRVYTRSSPVGPHIENYPNATKGILFEASNSPYKSMAVRHREQKATLQYTGHMRLFYKVWLTEPPMDPHLT